MIISHQIIPKQFFYYFLHLLTLESLSQKNSLTTVHCSTVSRDVANGTYYYYILTSLGSLFRHMATNSLKALLKFPVNSGGLFLGIKNKTLMGWRSELGGSPLASSIAVIPRDQISACKKIKSQQKLLTLKAITY